MATRFYLPDLSPSQVTPSFDAAWTLTGSALRRRMHTVLKTTTETVANTVVSSTNPGDVVIHRQYVSDPMASGIVFDTSTTYKCYVQGLESGTNDNAFPRLGVRIVSYDGSTVRATLLAVADYAGTPEFNTALRNKIFANGDAGTNASYTTQAGDRLVAELGHSDTGGSGITVTLRWGETSAGGGDLAENETATGTTFRPWFETSATVTFLELADDFEVTPDNTSLTPGNTSATTMAGVPVSDSGRTPAVGSFAAMYAAAAGVITSRYDHLSVAEAWYRFYFQMDTLPPATNLLLLVRNAGAVAADVQISTAGAVRLRDQTQTLIDTSAGNLAIDVWHRLEFHLSASANRWEARIFSSPSEHGGLNAQAEGETALGGTVSVTTWDNLSIGVGTSATWTIWLDALAVRFDGWVGSATPFSLPPRARHPMQPMLTR